MARNAFQKRRERQLLLLLLPAILPLLLLVIYPALYAVFLSMTNEALTGAAALHPRFVGLNNYFRLFGDGRFWNSLLVTAIFVVGSAIIGQFVLGFAAALLLHRRIRGAAAFGIAILLPNAAPEVVAGFMWISMLAGGDHATLSKIMIALGLPWTDWLQTMPLFMTTMVNTWRGIGTAMILLTAGLSAIPNDVYEAARVDGASELTIFRKIMIPLSVPPLAALFIIDTLATWNEFLLPLVLTSGKDSRTVPLGLLQFQGEHSSQYTLLMAGVLISIIPVLVIFLFLQRYFVAGLTAGAVKG